MLKVNNKRIGIQLGANPYAFLILGVLKSKKEKKEVACLNQRTSKPT